ncbi:uncharacterized protein METZ01_LOCUS485710, partial [marine metagenome]
VKEQWICILADDPLGYNGVVVRFLSYCPDKGNNAVHVLTPIFFKA